MTSRQIRTAGIFEAKQQLSALVDAVEAGEEVRITRHGRVVARLVPAHAVGSGDDGASAAVPPSKGAEALRALRAWRSRVKPGPGWKELRDEGRRV